MERRFADENVRYEMLGVPQPANSAPRTPHGAMLREAVLLNSKRLAELMAQAERIADRVVGVQPEGKSGGSDSMRDSNGFLDEMRSVVGEQSYVLAQIADHLNRLEAELG